MTIYCTYVDINYLPRFLALLASLSTSSHKSEQILLLALDSDVEVYFSKAPKSELRIVTLGELQHQYPELEIAKANRSTMEYVFTLTPFLMKLAMEAAAPEEAVVYLDADLFFFKSPALVLDDMSTSDVGLIPHGHSKQDLKRLGKYGFFNVGWVGIRNSQNGRECVEWWAEQCLTWCGDEPRDGKYADQGYLNHFPNLFRGVRVLEHQGFNLAPWNTRERRISDDSNGGVSVGLQPLVFFHFHGLRRFGKWMVTSQLNYRAPASKQLIDLVYKPYLEVLSRAEDTVARHRFIKAAPRLVRGRGLRRWARTLSGKLLMVASVITGNAVDMSKLK